MEATGGRATWRVMGAMWRDSNLEGDGDNGGCGWRESAEVMEAADGGEMVSGGGGWGRCIGMENGGWCKCVEVGGHRGDGGHRWMERRKVEDGFGARMETR